MKILFLLFIIFSIIHYFYETILAPSFHLSLKYDLFTLRDRLRRLKKAYGNRFDASTYKYMQSSINNLISTLPAIDISLISKIQKILNKNKDLDDKVNKVVEILNRCNIQEVQKIRNSSTKIFAKAILINNGMLFLYLSPILILMIFLKTLIKKIINSIQGWIYLPESEFSRIVLQ